MKGLIVAGTSSGSGKTVATLVVLTALQQAGEDPQPAKIGPDFIDPSHHTFVAGKASRTLDLWLQGEEEMLRNYARGKGTICVAEGVMGLYDGELSSTAMVAERLGLPVVLVVDSSAGIQSVSATALGFREYARYSGLDIGLVGIIAQKASGGRHEQGIMDSLPDGIEYLGRIPFLAGLEIPDRHLGLFMGEESPIDKGTLNDAARHIKASRLLELACEPEVEIPIDGGYGKATGKRIAVAHDEAFQFLYPGTLEVLQKRAHVETFSPLAGEIPEGADGIYLPGGYPELYLEGLTDSPTLEYLRKKASEGLPMFGECGGMMVLCRAITNTKGEVYDMAGILPARVEMVDNLQSLDYIQARAVVDTPIGGKGQLLRGHEFHYSKVIPESHAQYGLKMDKGSGITGSYDGLTRNNVIGTYAHFHGASGLFDYFIENI